MEVKSVAVIGAGTMGNGIAQVIAASDTAVIMTDINDAGLRRGLDAIDKSLQRLVSQQKLHASDKDALLARIRITMQLEDIADCDVIGLDTCLAILQVPYEGFKDPKYRPCLLWQEKVDAGHLGRKSGRGFFDYSNN
jgi:3-hydroxyacyl-CoA dehydrogenase